MPLSQNGYAANDISRTKVWEIPGTSRTIRLEKGAPGEALVLFAAWFHQNIEPIDTGIYDDWGYAERPIRGSTTTLSNHASGTAIDLNATKHPLGTSPYANFTEHQIAKIRAELKRWNGVIRWGGDYSGRKDPMHFEINASRSAVVAALAKMKVTNKVHRIIKKTQVRISYKRVRAEFLKAVRGEPVTKRYGVKVVQAWLNHLYGLDLEVDGYVGPKTLNAWALHERRTVGKNGRPRVPDKASMDALAQKFHVIY